MTTGEPHAVRAGELGPDVRAWQFGPCAPPLFIERVGAALSDRDGFMHWLRAGRNVLDALILEHGGIVLRGFPVATAADFDTLAGIFPPYRAGYRAGMSPRRAITGRVMESTRMVETFRIPLHSEMAYMKRYPARIAFFCRQAAAVGGETIIGDMRGFMAALPPSLADKLARHAVDVVRNYGPVGNMRDAATIDHPDKIGWDHAFQTDSRAEVEAHCRRLGLRPVWNEDDSLTLRERYLPLTSHPQTGETFYRASLHSNGSYERQGLSGLAAAVRAKQKHPTGHYFDNGETLGPEEAATMAGLFAAIERAWAWRDGDVMILDNLRVVHGRNPYSGPKEVMVALLDEPDTRRVALSHLSC